MEIAQLRYLVAIADEGGFSQAARRLKLSQPSLSLAIKKLEEEIGHPLFDRLARKVVPTHAGERMIDSARRILADLDRAAGEVRDMKGEVAGVLRVGAIPTIGPFVLPDLMVEFSGKYPDVTLHIVEDVTGRLMPLLEEGGLDLALVSNVPDRPGIHTDLLGNEELLALLPKDSPLAAGTGGVDWQEFEKERFLVLGEEHCLAEQVSWFCRKNRISGRIMMEGTQLSTIAAMVGRGMGVSLVPSLMADSALDGVAFRKMDGPVIQRPIFAAWSVLRYRTQASREFIRMAREALSKRLQA